MVQYLTRQDVANALHIGQSASYALFKRPEFGAVRIGRKLVVSEENLRRFMDNGGTNGDRLVETKR